MSHVNYRVAHAVGEDVNIIAIDQRATVVQVCISGVAQHVTFECVWFSAGVRQSTWLHGFEIDDAGAPSERNQPGFTK